MEMDRANTIFIGRCPVSNQRVIKYKNYLIQTVTPHYLLKTPEGEVKRFQEVKFRVEGIGVFHNLADAKLAIEEEG
jgi:hypothetical protein